MKLAISPCPNDSFLFYAWIHKLIETPLELTPHYFDIETLNQHALHGSYPLIKLSFATLAPVLHRYQLLPVGATLGINCGPKIIAKKPLEADFGRLAIPGENTTAHLLFNRLGLKAKEKIFCRYDEIFSLLDRDLVDSGLIIHESRFTFQEAGFIELADLGELWGGLLPLGAIALHRNSPHTEEIILALQRSLQYGLDHPHEAEKFILSLSREKDPTVVYKHIQTYINEETMHITEQGMRAIERLTHAKADTLCPLFRSRTPDQRA